MPTLITDTRRRLSELTSADEFETLATAVLREAAPAYAALIHTGTNVDGRTVRSPVDGIGLTAYRGTRRLLLVQHTITARRELRRKWLDPKDGDLAKAAAILASEQARGTVREATVVLASSADPDEALVRDVHAAAIKGMTVDLWPGSRIADFLDRNPEGQWLRQRQFGTAAARLSLSAAREISQQSLDAYLPLVERADVVARSLDARLKRFASGARGTGFVIGESGLGKSTSLRRLGDAWVEDGGIALVLDEAMIGNMATIDQAVSAELRRWVPSLESDCGKVALSLATQRPLLLIVEDVNRSTNPRRIVERLVAWSAKAGSNEAAVWRVLCPIWRGNAAVADQGLREKVLSSSFAIDRFERSEATAAVRARAAASGVELTSLQLSDMAAAFGDDPLLIALNTNWSTPDPGEAIRSYVADNIAQAADDRLLASDLRDTLQSLIGHMVEARSVFPSWTEIRAWFTSDAGGLGAIRRLVDHGRVIRLGDDDRLAYRHDRVRDELLTTAIKRLIEEDRFASELWEEPFYAELIGAALRTLPPMAAEIAETRNPVALFAALEDPGLDESVRRRLVGAARRWTASTGSKAPGEESRRHHATRCLARTDGAFVADLAQALPHSFLRLEALARNGDARAAAAICRTADPGVRDGWRDRIISHALSRHPEMLTRLAALLRNDEIKDRSLEGALNLAGEIGDPALCTALAERWERDGGRESISTGWLWAALRCCPPIGHPLVEEVCQIWAQLPTRVGRGPDKRDRNPRWDIAGYTLPWAFSRKPTPASVDYLLRLPKRHRGLTHVVSSITSHIDTPEAVLHSVRASAEIDRRIEGTKRVNLGAHDLVRIWSPQQHGRTLSEASRSALEKIWRNRRVNRFHRKAAFSLWCLTPTAEEVARLRELESDTALADQALRARLEAGDQLAVPLLSERIWGTERGWWWWYQARPVGLSGLREDVLRFFAERRRVPPKQEDNHPDHILAQLLMDEDDSFANGVIVENWESLRTSPHYVQAALYLATPETVALGRSAVRESGDVHKMLRFVDMHWGIRTVGRAGVTRLAQLQALEPFYAEIRQAEHGDLNIGTFFDAANELGVIAWRKEHLDPLIAENDRGYCPSDDRALFASLDAEVDIHVRYERDYFAIDHWFERREGELWERGRLLGLVGEWARQRASEPAVRLLCEALTLFGERRELGLLERLDPALRTACAASIANCVYDVRRRSLGASVGLTRE